MAEDADKEINTEECSQQEAKLKQMPKYILKKWTSVMSKLERTCDKSQAIHLSKMKSLHATLTNSNEKLKIETLMQCNDVLKKLMEKVDKVPCGQEYVFPGTKLGNTAAVCDSSNDKSESRLHHTHSRSRTEVPCENLQAGRSSSLKPSITNDEASLNNEWLPSHKNSAALENMLSLDSLRDLYKCMDGECYWTGNGARSFLCHIKNEHFNKIYSEWNSCSYCPFQGDGTPQVLIQHITVKHGHCLYQCVYCFFRGMTCSYVVLHQNMFHANKLVRVLQCDDLKISPPTESELQPLESVVQPYICIQGSCGKLFYNPKDFLLHLQQQHNRASRLTCHICKAIHLKAACLISHYKFHSLALYQCRHCQYGAERVEEIHQHLCNRHHNLPPLLVLRHYEPNEQTATDADFNELEIVNLDPSVLDDVASRAPESVVGGMMTGIQSEIFTEESTVDGNEPAAILFYQMTETEIDDDMQKASFEMVENQVASSISKGAVVPKTAPLKISSSSQEPNRQRWFCDRSPYRKQDVEKNGVNTDGFYGDEDVEVVYCQLGVKDKYSKLITCLGSCSQARKESPIEEVKNSVSGLIIETDSQNSPDSVIFIDESLNTEAESEHTQEPTTHEAFLVSTPNKSSSQFVIQNAECASNIDSGRNSFVTFVNATYSADEPQTFSDSEGPAVTEGNLTEGDRRKQFIASGLAGEDLYLCGNAPCVYRAATKSQLWDHMCACDLSPGGVVQCPHCSQSFKAFSAFINHLSAHAVPRYLCASCTYHATAPTAVEKHLKYQHKVSRTEIISTDHSISNHDTNMFVVSPKGKGKAKRNPAGHEVKSMYTPEEIHILPLSGIQKEPIHCFECSFKTKVCSSMKQLLSLHREQDVDTADIPAMEDLNPVVRIENNEKMFDKLTNLSDSSNTGVTKLTSSVTSNNFESAVNAGAADDSGKSGEVVQDAASGTKSKLANEAGVQQATTSVHNQPQPSTSSSPGQEVQEAASATTTSQPSKRAAALRARASIRDLAVAMDVAAAIMYQPKMRAAAVRAMASIRDLSEFVLAGSPIASPKGSDYEEPGLKKKVKVVFNSSPQQKKKTMSKEQKISCNYCRKKFINVRGLKQHIRWSHSITPNFRRWRCGYCHQKRSTEMAIKRHCRKRHSGMPELVTHIEGNMSATLDSVRPRSMPKLEKYDEETASLQLGKGSLKSNHGLPPKTITAASSSSSSAQHPESLLVKANQETKLPKLLTEEKARRSKRKSSQSTLLKLHDESHYNKKFSITESTAHCFECYECSFETLSLQVLRKHFEMEHRNCEFRYVVKPSKLSRDRSDNVTTKTSAIRSHSSISTSCDAGHYICMLCSATTVSEEQFHCNHHSVHHPNVEPKYYFQTVGHEAKHTKFECQKCCFNSDNFEILKEHLQLHITAFQMWLSAQKCNLEMKVVSHKFSDIGCDCTEMKLEEWKKSAVQGSVKAGESLSPAVPVLEKKVMHNTRSRVQEVNQETASPSSVSSKPLIKSANKSKDDCPGIDLSKNCNTGSSYSCYGRSPSPIDENRLLIFANYGGSCLRMSVSTFSKIHNIYPKVKVRDLKHEKWTPF